MSKKAILILALAIPVCFNAHLRAQSEQCLPVCSDGPCFSLQAVAVNGAPIPPTTCVRVNSGDILETEIRISNWGTALPDGANIYEAFVNPEGSARTGESGLILPLGWDGPVPTATCYANSDCPGSRWSCVGAVLTYPRRRGVCLGPQHNPSIGISLDVERPDFVFAGSPLDSMVPYGVGFNHLYWYVWFAILDLGQYPHPMAFDTGGSSYAGTLRLKVSLDACGDFQYRFGPSDANCLWFFQPPTEVTAYGHLFPLTISVDCDCNDDGIPDYQAIASGVSKDCNVNGRPDLCDIADGVSADENADHIPDECRQRPGRLPSD